MVYTSTKLFIDIVGSILLGVFFFPVSILTAIAIYLDSPGPIFADTPQRVGKRGKLFKLYKFRSMVVNAHEKLRSDPRLAKLYNEYKKTAINYRMTRG